MYLLRVLVYKMTVELVLCTQELCEKGACGTFRVEVGKDRYVVSACRIVFISGSVDYMKFKKCREDCKNCTLWLSPKLIFVINN